MEIIPTKKVAEALLKEHIKEDYLKLHSKMVAIVMEAYAKKFNEDSDMWYVTGLLHDLDYEKFPKEHPKKSIEWMKEWNYDERIIHAVRAHGTREPRTKPESTLAKALIAVDELCGLLYAYSLMRPTGFQGMEAKSVMKKFKDKAFAAKIDREEINYGVNEMGIDLKEHIDFMINVLNTGQF